jgi:hypothetical protein
VVGLGGFRGLPTECRFGDANAGIGFTEIEAGS